MKVLALLPLAALVHSFVLPDQDTIDALRIKTQHTFNDIVETIPSPEEIRSHFGETFEGFKEDFEGVKEDVEDMFENLEESFDNFIEAADVAVNDATGHFSEFTSDAHSWIESSMCYEPEDHGHHGPGHGKKPHHGRPGHGRPPHHRPGHGKKPHHGHDKPNETIYQIISKSKYTTKLAKIVSEDEELVDILNGTSAKFTFFAPTDRAFEKIPDHHHEPTKEQIRNLIKYHISPEFNPAGRVLRTQTIPTLLNSDSLGSEPLPQRLAVKLTFRGLTLNFYARIIATNFFATNGVIHGLDSIVLPPPRGIKIIDLFPSEFSTLELGLAKTGLLEKLNTTDHNGGTFFAPSNWAFQKLGPKLNAFLFSSHGLKYLKALLKYHVVPERTLYSDAYYDGHTQRQGPRECEADEIAEMEAAAGPFATITDCVMNTPKHDVTQQGRYHIDLPTLLKDRHISVDVARYKFFVSIRLNAFTRVSTTDAVAKDGVIHTLSDVLVPPRQHHKDDVEGEDDEGTTLTMEEFLSRLEPYVDDEE